MKADKIGIIAVAQAIFALFAAPLLWPLMWIASLKFYPGSTDPLLGGMENILYYPALIWLLLILLVTVVVAKLFRLKRTNKLFLTTGLGCALTLCTILSVIGAWGDYQMIGQKSVVYPTHFDAAHHARQFVQWAAYFMTLTFVTTGIFVIIGGFRMWKSKSETAAPSDAAG